MELDQLRDRLGPVTGPALVAMASGSNDINTRTSNAKACSTSVENLVGLAHQIEGLREAMRDLLERVEV